MSHVSSFRVCPLDRRGWKAIAIGSPHPSPLPVRLLSSLLSRPASTDLLQTGVGREGELRAKKQVQVQQVRHLVMDHD